MYVLAQGNSLGGRWIIGLSSIAIGAAILVGFMTPVAALLIGLGTIGLAISRFPMSTIAFCGDRVTLVFVLATAAAICLLGPGAFSLDARMFGRREITIPTSAGSQKS